MQLSRGNPAVLTEAWLPSLGIFLTASNNDYYTTIPYQALSLECTGYRAGSSALLPAPNLQDQVSAYVPQ
jgi:hypothetical protein